MASWVELLEQGAAEARASGVGNPWHQTGERVPFVELLKRTAAAARASGVGDPWRLRLERVRGKLWDDDIERISTQTLFDILEVPQRGRTAGACRRLAKLMRELGWTPIKARGLTPGGFRDQVRGWARDKRGSPLC
jgi:hypothetical protein